MITTPTTTEAWYWTPPGGAPVCLQLPFWNVSTAGGSSRFSLPSLRGSDIEVPFKSGQSWRSKYPNSRTLTLVMWTAGIDQDSGVPAADQRLAWNDNFTLLRSLFWNEGPQGSQRGQLTRSVYLTQDGTPQIVTAVATAEIAGTMEPTMTGRTRADFSVDLLLSDPYFYGTQQVSTVDIGSTVVTNPAEGMAGHGFDTSFTIALNGPLTNPILANGTWDVSLGLGMTIGAGQTVDLDIINFTAIDNTGTSQLEWLTHAGARMWMCLGSGANDLTLSTSNPADTGSAVLTCAPPYL